MEEVYDNSAGGALTDINTRIRDIEERQRVLRDRILLVSETLVKEKEKSFTEIQNMKSLLEKIKEENIRMREVLKSITEIANNSARKEDLMILQRQFDIFRQK